VAATLSKQGRAIGPDEMIPRRSLLVLAGVFWSARVVDRHVKFVGMVDFFVYLLIFKIIYPRISAVDTSHEREGGK